MLSCTLLVTLNYLVGIYSESGYSISAWKFPLKFIFSLEN